MKRARRMAAIIMVAMMVATLLPSTAFAATAKKYAVTIKYQYTNGKTAVKTYTKSFKKGATTKSISVNVPQKNGYTVSLAKRTGAAAKKNVTVKLNAKKTKVTYKVKKINANVSLKFIYKKKATPKPAVNPTTPAEEPPTVTYPAAVLTATADDITVTATIPEGAFPEGTSMTVAKMNADDYANKVDGRIKAAVDIMFKDKSGKEIEPLKLIDVKMAVAGYDLNQSYKVVHIPDEQAKPAEPVNAVVDTTAAPTTVSFSADDFSVYALVWEDDGEEQTATIHWGTYEGDTFTELEDSTTIDASAASAKLDMVIDGYYYVGAEYKASDDADVQVLTSPSLKKVDGKWQITVSGATEGTTEDVVLADGSNIYVNYAKKGSGGGDEPAEPEPKPEDVEGPETSKHVTDNGDGTYTIQLDIEGKQDHQVTKVGANVIVVMDVTSSMGLSMGSTTRMAAAKSALNTLITTLNPGTEEDQNLINFAAVNFGNGASARPGSIGWTQDKEDMLDYVDSLQAVDNGTCWQAGIQEAIELVTDAKQDEELSKNDTYVVFVTDGNPNCYTDAQGRWHGASGYDISMPAFNAANDIAPDLAALCKTKASGESTLYGIFCGAEGDSGATYLEQLISNAPGKETIAATSQTAIENAFKSIAETIVNNIGASNVSVDDGVPSLSSVSANVTAGEAGGFEYYITPKGGTQTTWDDAPGASYSNSNGVTWDLSAAGTLQDEYVYTLKFRVWPSQEAYDLIADLNNGKVSMTDKELEEAGIEKVGGVYRLKTNTHLYTTFTDAEGNTYKESNNWEEEAMLLPTNTIKVVKYWHNEMDSREAQDVTLSLTKDGEWYRDIKMGTPTQISDHEWQQTPTDSIYISVGNMSCNEDTNELTINSSGHEYTVIEPEEFTYRWDLSADIYHPMMINNVQTVLVEVPEDEIPEDLASLADNKKAESDGKVYYKFDGKLYVVQDAEDDGNVLTAHNDRRSNLAINKIVTGEGAPKDTTFAFMITMDNEKSLHPGDEGYDTDYDAFWFAVQTDPKDRKTVVKDVEVEGATAEEGDTGFYWFDNGGTVTVYLKADQYICFTNLPKDTNYSIEEDTSKLVDGFEFVEATSKAVNNVEGETSTPATITDNKAEGTIDKPNSDYSVTYTNNCTGFYYVYHSSDNTVERFSMLENGEPVTSFNIVDMTAKGTLYGGYYKDYAGKSSGFDASKLTYTDDKATDSNGKAYDCAYIEESDRGAWKDSKAYTESGKAVKPEQNTVYFLKEVPTAYLLPYTHYTYTKEDKVLHNMWYLSGIDDLNYDQAGFFVTTIDKDGKEEAEVVDTLTVNSSGGSTVKLTPKSVFGAKGVKAGYLDYWDASDLIEEGATSVFTPFWCTLDGIYVCGTKTRTIKFNTATVGSGGMAITNGSCETPFPEITD